MSLPIADVQTNKPGWITQNSIQPFRLKPLGSSAMKRTACVLATAAFLGAVLLPAGRNAQARWFSPVGWGLGYSAVGGYGGWGYGLGYGGWGNYGGTVGGNYMQGMSQVIRAQGQYNLDTSKAYINYEEARTKYIDNKKKWTETYFAMREQNQARQAEKTERSRHSAETHVLAARSNLPRPLSSEALDPVTGKITWPTLLQDSAFSASREELERLFELRASTSGSSATDLQIQQVVQGMIETLKSNIHTLPANDYIAARKFLDSLSFSVRA